MTANSLGDVIRTFMPELLKVQKVSSHQLKVLQAISNCRTTEMGGSAMACKCCGQVQYVLHSCRDRHCPQCQGIDKELWIEDRKQELLPVKYYHVVFTVPHLLNELFRFNRKVMYSLLFEVAWDTLNEFSQDPAWLGAQSGAIGILHTWDQQMKFHPHVHFIVPAGGIDKNSQWKTTKQNGDFLFDVKQLSSVFSARFVKKLRKLKMQGKIAKRVPRDMIPKPWVVYAKQAFGSTDSVVEYLGRYTHKVAISNARITKVTQSHVTFRWCNRKEGYKKKYQTITGVKFLKRFIEHIVPPYFRRIRYFGFLSPRNKSKCIEKILEQLCADVEKATTPSRAEVLSMRFGERSVLSCKDCGGEMVLLKSYPGKRAPPINNMSGLSATA